jgi:hypothetical protein
MTHSFTIALDHRLQFIDILRCDLSPDKAIQAINNCQHPDNKIDTDIHNPTIVTQLNGEQYKESKWSVSIDLIFQLSVRSMAGKSRSIQKDFETLTGGDRPNPVVRSMGRSTN